jgi:hypothetical protein
MERADPSDMGDDCGDQKIAQADAWRAMADDDEHSAYAVAP